jgi:hypothetical protein
MSLYVQASRAVSWNGIFLLREPRRKDFIEPKIMINGLLKAVVQKLEGVGGETRESFERNNAGAGCFEGWRATSEAATRRAVGHTFL